MSPKGSNAVVVLVGLDLSRKKVDCTPIEMSGGHIFVKPPT